MKKIIRLTESDLHRIVKESVQKILRESMYDPYEGGDFYILYSPEVGFLENETYESYEAAQEALMEYGNSYEDLTVYFVPGGDFSNAEEA